MTINSNQKQKEKKKEKKQVALTTNERGYWMPQQLCQRVEVLIVADAHSPWLIMLLFLLFTHW